jgi:predicted Zn finger-like uncharacterized protein
MITRCPKCATAFRVTPAQLAVADGSVRCGSCLSVFKALDQINKTVNKNRVQQANKLSTTKVVPTPASMVSPKKDNQTIQFTKVGKTFSEKENIVDAYSNVHDVSEETIAVNDSDRQKQEPKTTTNLHKQEGSFQKPTINHIKHSKNDNEAVDCNTVEGVDRISLRGIPHGKGALLSTIQPAPVEMLWNEDKSTNRVWLWFFGVILLILLMAFQIATFEFQNLSKVDPYRSIYRVMCPVLRCALPDLVDTTKIRVSNLILRSHPTINGVLVIDTILVNSAKFAQPYPDLSLEFNDINNKKIAFRQFYAGEYLGGELAGTTLMPVNQPVQLSIEIVDPGPEAVNYQMYVAQPRNRS